MPKTITKTITLYEFNELDERAKEKARDWWREGGLDWEWWDNTYDDAKQIGLEITSFDLDRNKHAKGKFVDDAEYCAKAIIENHGETCETYKTAKAFLQRLDSLATEYPEDSEGYRGADYEDEKQTEEEEFLHLLLQDYASMLQQECDYLQSDEHIDEMIKINEYTFTEEGNRLDA